MTHPALPDEIRGTYAGIGAPGDHRAPAPLGVTAIELMPVHQFVQDHHLVERGLSNYWGYNTIGFFAPHNAYSLQRPARPAGARSSRRWSASCTRAGIEVILDVVYNHTAEGNQLGPTLSFRGIDNPAYYRLVDGQPRALLRHHRHRQHAC